VGFRHPTRREEPTRPGRSRGRIVDGTLDAPPGEAFPSGTMATKKTKTKAPEKATPRAAAATGKKGAKAPTSQPARAARKASVSKTVSKPAAKGVGKPAGKAAGKPAGKAPARKATGTGTTRRRTAARPPAVEGLDPDGYFVARVRGEEAARQAPHPMTEGEEREDPMALRALADVPVPADDEGLGDLPWSYGEDVFVGLPRDPRTMFFYWDHSPETRKEGFEWLDRPRAQLRILALRKDGEWEEVRVVEFALEARGFYVHDLEPGRTYRGVIVAVSRDGRERMVGEPSNEVALPSSGPSPVVEDRFATIPWELPLEEWLRDVRVGSAFPEEVRAMLSRLSKGKKPARPAWDVRTERSADPDHPSSPTRAWGGGAGKRGGKEGA
jgi:hypothetical protein